MFYLWKKAYDSIHRQSLLNILKEFHFPINLINLIEATLKSTEIKVKVTSKVSTPVKVTISLSQGDALSLILFNLILEKVITEMNGNVNDGIILENSNINFLAYTDDIALLGNTEKEMKRFCGKFLTLSEKVGL